MSVVVAGSGVVAVELLRWYRESGADVFGVDFGTLIEPQAASITGPIDLLVIADDFEPARGKVATLTRGAMGPAMRRLTYLPFALAALLKPQLAKAQGRVVLLSRTDARMEVPDAAGRYLERPFRAAAHTLWRCLSVEWRDAGISAGLVAIEPGSAPVVAELADAIVGDDEAPFPVELVDVQGKVLGW
ncbi:MAG: hypothetical protein ACO1OG_03640 [Devosia sp.]